MAGLVPTDFAVRAGGIGLTSFDVFHSTGASGKEKSLRDQLESGNVKEALQAMKKTIKMLSSGEDASDLFPSVVKHVASPDVEIKKLVYVYLVRYAEEQPDIALLSINSFQKDLKDPSQFIRASALRVMSSIRVDVIIPLIMLAVKQTIMDMSPYVRKVTAHAIPKVYSMDPTQKDELIKLVEQLLGDRATLVLGSAVHTFEAVCPDRYDLIHKHFRKICTVVVDLDEWGQIACLELLTRYARTQFLDPNLGEGDEEDEDRPFYNESDDESSSDSRSQSDDSDKSDNESQRPKRVGPMDPDHRLLLNSVKPLLLSRNSGVVFAVAQLYYYLAPRAEMQVVGKAMTRLVRSNREIAHTVLRTIESMSVKRPNMFALHLKAFFLMNDPVTVATTKINIMTNLVSSINIATILREFSAYIRGTKMEIVVAAIDAIGRCAAKIPEVTSQCITSLMAFLSSSNEEVAGMCIVTIKRLLQQQDDAETNKDNVAALGKMLLKGKITVPMARASVMWLIGEYAETVPRIAPDVLRLGTKNFVGSVQIEKLQVLNLGVKLYLIGARKAERLLRHVINLCKYDPDYDVRDRARMMKAILFDERVSTIKDHVNEIFLSSKPAPKFQDTSVGRESHVLGSLSNLLGTDMPGYIPMPEFPETAPDPKPRQVELQQDFYSNSLSNRVGGFEMFPKEYRNNHDEPQGDFYDSSTSESDSDTDSDSRSSRASSRSRSRSSDSYCTDRSASDTEDSDSSSSFSRKRRNHRPNRQVSSRSRSTSRSSNSSSGSSTRSHTPLPPREHHSSSSRTKTR